MKLTIVIAATVMGALERSLQALKSESFGHQIELLLAHQNRPDLLKMAHSFGMKVRSIECPAGLSVFEMRQLAIRQAETEFVAVLGERYAIRPGWLPAAQHLDQCDILTGAIAPQQGQTFLGWSIYLAEYAHFLGELPTGVLSQQEATRIAGGNTMYRRSVLTDGSGLSELAFHEMLLGRGCRFHRSANMTAEFAFASGWRKYLQERFQLSGEWGSQQASGKTASWRLALAFSRLALPPLLLFRQGSAVWRAREQRLRYFYTLPVLAIYSVTQMAGEFSGLLFGSSSVRVNGPRSLQ